MVSVIWVSLPANWSLYSVQAGLQVVIAVLCFVGVFVFARSCWQTSSLALVRHHPTALPSLISIHTISEAYDAIFLLRLRIFHQQHWKILAQSVIVLLLSASTIVSGPLAKASTRLGMVVRSVEMNGLLANRRFDSFTYGYVQWNQTIQKLNNAGFPSNQLLDFLPDPKFDWVFKASEWNSSWSLSCSTTESTPVTIYDTGICKNVYTELNGVDEFFPQNNFDVIYGSPYMLHRGNRTTSSLLILTGWTPDPGSNSYRQSDKLTFAVAALLMSGLGRSSDSDCLFDKGAVDASSYTMAQCDIQKVANVDTVDENAAYPDHNDLDSVSVAYRAHFAPRVAAESGIGVPVAPIPPSELIRFYQAFEIAKDTFEQHPIKRTISERVQVPQISATFLALGGLICLLDIAGLINVLWFSWKYFDVVCSTPESKLDWALQSIDESPVSTAIPVLKSTGTSHKSFSAVSPMPREGPITMRKLNKMRALFESARYGSHGGTIQESMPLTQYPGPINRTGPIDFDGQSQHSALSVGLVSPPAPSLYNISPYEAQFASQEISYSSDQTNHNADYFVGGSDTSSIRPWHRRHYQPLSQPDVQ